LNAGNKNNALFSVSGAKYWGYDCSGQYRTSGGYLRYVTAIKRGDTLKVVFDLRNGQDSLEYFINGNSLGKIGSGIQSQLNYQISLGFSSNQAGNTIVLTDYRIDGGMADLTLVSSQATTYSYTNDFRLTKLFTKYQGIRTKQFLPNGRVTTIKIKLVEGFIFIFGAA